MVGMSSSAYLISYYNASTEVIKNYGYGTINTILITVTDDGSTTTDGIKLSLSNATSLVDSSAIFSIAMTSVGNTTAVIVYTDFHHNYAIYCQSIHLQIDEESELTSIGNMTPPPTAIQPPIHLFINSNAIVIISYVSVVNLGTNELG